MVEKKSLKASDTSSGLEDKELLMLREIEFEEEGEDIISLTPCHSFQRLPQF